MVNDEQDATASNDHGGGYNELSADAGDERHIRRQAAALADVQQPESAGPSDALDDAGPDEVEVAMPNGESVEYQLRAFDEAVVREEDAAQGAVTADIEGQPQRLRDRLNAIEREVDGQLDDESIA